MALNANLVFLWPGTHASIPSGWQRDTRFDDGMYLKAAEAAANPTTGGAATHTHPDTSTSHLHPVAAAASLGDRIGLGTGKGFATDTHIHASFNSAAGTFSGAATANLPPYYDMIFIKPITGGGCPDDACAFWDDAALPTDWDEYADSKTYFLRGAPTAGDAGGTGGAATHGHNTDHAHASVNSSSSSAGSSARPGGTPYVKHPHTHPVSLDSGSANVADGDSEPSWYKLRVIQNGTGAEALPDQVIALWLGNHADIPANWARVTGPDGVLLKCASNSGEVGDSATKETHTHEGADHNHSATAGIESAFVVGDGDGIYRLRYPNSHPWTVGNASKGLVANSSKSHYPTFQEAIFVRYTTPVSIRLLASTGVGR